MAAGISAKLPLVVSDVFGAYDLNTNFADLATQNLKMLLLTNPGERIMNPSFGVGIRKFFFENNDSSTYSLITDRIRSQAKIYMKFIRIDDITCFFCWFEGDRDRPVGGDFYGVPCKYSF